MDEKPPPLGLPATPDEAAPASVAPPTSPVVAAPMPNATAPTGAGERLESLDVLRGFALLGIFTMNITTFGLLSEAYFDPNFAGVESAADWVAWGVNFVVFEQKMMTLFSLLFGAGIVLFASRAEAKGGSVYALHYRRMGWLALFGLLHAYLLWFGDILFPYAVCGMLVFLMRGLSVRVLLLISGALFVASFASLAMNGVGMTLFDPVAAGPATPDRIASAMRTEGAALSGDYVDRWGFNAKNSFFMHAWGLPFMYLPHNSALMLLGMAMFKSGFLQGSWSSRGYVRMLLVAAPASLALLVGEWLVRKQSGFGMGTFFTYGMVFALPAAAGMATVYIAAVNLAIKAGVLGRVRGALAAVGRIAFTNYIMQTVIACLIFYRPGLGLFMEFTRAELWLIVLGMWAWQVAFSVAYLRFFRMGPLEYVWRAGTYGRWRLSRREG